MFDFFYSKNNLYDLYISLFTNFTMLIFHKFNNIQLTINAKLLLIDSPITVC